MDGETSYGQTKRPEDGYDPSTNTTRVLVKVAKDRGNCWPRFQNTDRDGPGSEYGLHSGVNIKIMRPITPGSDEWHPKDELFARDAVYAFSNTFDLPLE